MLIRVRISSLANQASRQIKCKHAIVAEFCVIVQIIDECEGWCKKILEIVDSDVLSVETEHFIDASLATKTTVGIMAWHHSLPVAARVLENCGCQ